MGFFRPKKKKDEQLKVPKIFSEEIKSQLKETQEKENIITNKWWDLIKHNSSSDSGK